MDWSSKAANLDDKAKQKNSYVSKLVTVRKALL